jgi:hypothetical protein
MFGYARGGYLMAKTTPSPDVMMMMTGTTLRAADAAAEGEARTNGLQSVNGRVRPRTKESCSRSGSSSYGVQTRYKQTLWPLLQ